MAEGHPPAAAMASYRRSRLPFARPQTLQTLQKSAQLRREKVPQQALNTRHARRQKPPQGHSNGSRAPHGRSNGFLSAFQAAVCQASNPPNPPNPPKVRPTPQAKGTPTSSTRATPAGKSHHKATAMAQGHPPAAAMASAFKAAVCQASNPPKVRPAPQGKGTPTSPTRATPARKSHHKATAMAEGHPPATAMAQGHPPAAAMASFL